MKTLLVAGGLVLFASTAYAQTGVVDGAYVGCLTKANLSEVMTALSNNDSAQLAALNNVCLPIQGLQFSVVKRGIARSQIRIYNNNASVLLWTVTEATR